MDQRDWYTVRVKDGALWDGPFTYEDAKRLALQRTAETGEQYIVKRSKQSVKYKPCSACLASWKGSVPC